LIKFWLCLALAVSTSAASAVSAALNAPARGATAPGALHASPVSSWTPVFDAPLSNAASLLVDTSFSPILRALELKGWTPRGYAAAAEAVKTSAIAEAVAAVRAQAAEEAARALAEIAQADPASPEYPILAARLAQLAGPFSGFVPDEHRAAVLLAARAASARMGAAKSEKLARLIETMQENLSRPGELLETAVEAFVADLADPPARLMTPGVARLREAGDPVLKEAPPPPSSGLVFGSKVGLLKTRQAAVRLVARGLYRPLLDAFRLVMTRAGEICRKYISGREQDKHNFRWSVLEFLHRKGDFRGSFGHPVYQGQPEIMSPVIFNEPNLESLRTQKHDLRGAQISPMLGISGMSFPQLSAQSHLSLLYIHLKLAKEQGARILYNTGEGGPGLLLGLMEGDAAKMKAGIVAWNTANGQFQAGSWNEARIVALIDVLMAQRRALFAEFSAEDLARAQIVAQFGSALNGIRRDDAEGRVDFDKLRRVAANPHVAMVQYKLKQAAKRGAKIDPRKVNDIVAAWREIPRNRSFRSPERIADMQSYGEIAALIKATRSVSAKPVSLKFGIGDAADLLDFMRFLRDADALPDHLQIDGRGDDFSPGSGNAPPGANTSLPANEAVIVIDAVLKKLGARDRVFIDAGGDVMLAAEAVERLVLGADGVCGARTWMAMGLGCSKVKACADGNCPYGIASRNGSLVGLGLDPQVLGPKGYAAAANWQKSFVQALVEAGLTDWRKARAVLGLGTGSAAIRIKDGAKTVPLDRYYSPQYVADLLRGALTRQEVDRLVFGRR